MSALRMRFAGPMQSWGTQSRFTVRDTGLEPSKSGVVGLLCAALGRPRAQEVHDLANLPMAVRVDREGVMACDFHTAQEVLRADGSGCAETVISSRYYLADADFLVVLEGQRALLDRLDTALRRPVWPLYLGRKSFVPGWPIAWVDAAAAVLDDDLSTVMRSTDWRKRHEREAPPNRLRCVSDVPLGDSKSCEPRQDVPLSFAQRTFAVRQVWNGFVGVLAQHTQENADVSEPIDS
jgi:CRISPR system Cascade subunit CasD